LREPCFPLIIVFSSQHTACSAGEIMSQPDETRSVSSLTDLFRAMWDRSQTNPDVFAFLADHSDAPSKGKLA